MQRNRMSRSVDDTSEYSVQDARFAASQFVSRFIAPVGGTTAERCVSSKRRRKPSLTLEQYLYKNGVINPLNVYLSLENGTVHAATH